MSGILDILTSWLPPWGGDAGVAPAPVIREGTGEYAFSVPIPGGPPPEGFVLLEGQTHPVFTGFISGTATVTGHTWVYFDPRVPDGIGSTTIVFNLATLEPPERTGSLILEGRTRTQGSFTAADGVQFRSQLTVVKGTEEFKNVTGVGLIMGQNIEANGLRNVTAKYWLRLVWPQ